MKKRNLIAALLCSVCLTMGGTMPVMADSTKIVTLGADLTTDQQSTMMKYFKANADEVQIIYVTNSDERSYLGNYISSEQIGTRTLSCAYVKPTTSGGIKVRTANLNYVTCNMIASALSTAGITNCEAVAACPFEVSGTGALTGIMMAYEKATGTNLDSTKKDLATQEVVVTGNVAQQVGQDNATNIINQAKMQIIGENVQNADEIYNIVNNIAVQNNITLSSDELNTITALLQQIVQQNYDIQQMQKTLEDIQQNLEDSKKAQEGEVVATPTPEAEEDTSDGEDITADVDTDALGTDVIESSTEDANMASDSGMDTLNPASETEESTDSETGIPEATADGTYGDSDLDAADNEDYSGDLIDQSTIADQDLESDTSSEEASESTDEIYEGEVLESTDAPDFDTSAFSEEVAVRFADTKTFLSYAYTGDLTGLQTYMQENMSEMPQVTYLPTLDTDTSDKLTAKVEEIYYNILQQINDGTFYYESDGTEIYVTDEMNAVNKELRVLFGMGENNLVEGDILYNVSYEDRSALYNATIECFGSITQEDSSLFSTDSASADTAAAEEYTEDAGIDEMNVEEATY